MGKAGPTSPSVLNSFTHLDGLFLQLHFRHHSSSLLHAILAELWDGTVAGPACQRRKFSAYRIVKEDSKIGICLKPGAICPLLLPGSPCRKISHHFFIPHHFESVLGTRRSLRTAHLLPGSYSAQTPQDLYCKSKGRCLLGI